MPEGDTVYRAARTLDAALLGRQLVRAELRVPAHATADLVGMTVLADDTWGKHLFTRFDSGLTLHTHLRLDGSWHVAGRRPGRGGSSADRRQRMDRADAIRVLLGTSATTVIGERIPVVELLRTSDERRITDELGPDPLRDDWEPESAAERLGADPGRELAGALLDQRCLAGLGNFWVNEICFLRGYLPWTPIGATDVLATVRLAARALRASAFQPRMYQVTTGDTRAGASQWVYGRDNEPCRRCGTRVDVRAAEPGDPQHRRTWWCPHCQRDPSRGSVPDP